MSEGEKRDEKKVVVARVLRLLEYVYFSHERMIEDMARWGLGANATKVTPGQQIIRSSTLMPEGLAVDYAEVSRPDGLARCLRELAGMGVCATHEAESAGLTSSALIGSALLEGHVGCAAALFAGLALREMDSEPEGARERT